MPIPGWDVANLGPLQEGIVALMTVAVTTEHGWAHAWQVGTAEALCGTTVEALHATGSTWPPLTGDLCPRCVRLQRIRMSRSLWASVESWLDVGSEATTNPSTPEPPRPDPTIPPNGIGPGLRHLWDTPTT